MGRRGVSAIPAFTAESTGSEIEAAFRRAGVARFEALWPEARIAALREAFERAYPQLADEALINPARVQHVANRRYIVPVEIGGDCACLDLLLAPALTRAFVALLGEDWVYESVGVIVSFPGARRQHVHRDSAALFGGLPVERMLPPFALTLAIPLRPMDELLGSTGFWPGSHLDDDIPADPDQPAAPAAPCGSALLWNYRTAHCGMENRGEQPRPVLYATASRPFWREYRNNTPSGEFGLKVEQHLLDGLDEADRARFCRAV